MSYTSMFPQIPVSVHVVSERKCGGDLDMMWGDGDDGYRTRYSGFTMRCVKCGRLGTYNEDTAENGCKAIASPMEVINK